MNWNNAVRRFHRWMSVALTLTMVAYFVSMALGKPGEPPPPAVTYAPLLPLFLLILTGWYLFALPYVAKWRGAGPSA